MKTNVSTPEGRQHLRAWYLDPVRKLPRKVVADVLALVEEIELHRSLCARVGCDHSKAEHGSDGCVVCVVDDDGGETCSCSKFVPSPCSHKWRTVESSVSTSPVGRHCAVCNAWESR